MISVWCMNTGGFAPDEEVYTLKRQVDRHLSEPHEFVCITEKDIDGIETAKPINDLPGWWGKINLFAPTVSRKRNLWIDLDSVIVRSLNSCVAPLSGKQIRCGLNWAKSGFGSCQGTLVYWEGDSARIISDKFNHADAHWPPVNGKMWDNGQNQWSEQEWMTYLRDTGQLSVEYFKNSELRSYKYHCRGLDKPPHTSVVAFHGSPKPGEVEDEWVVECRAQ